MATDKLVHKRLYYLMMHTENIQISAWITEHAVEHLSLDNKWVSMVYSKGTSCRHFFLTNRFIYKRNKKVKKQLPLLKSSCFAQEWRVYSCIERQHDHEQWNK